MQVPILYPHPPYSTMNFLIASGSQNQIEVVEAHFVHKDIQIPTDTTIATYPIITAQEAFDELKSGKGYIAAFNRPDTNILINNDKAYLLSSTYLWSHVLNPNSSWSVLTGFAMYSEAPASRHFSRSPFIAFAVRAMIGRRRNSTFCRMTCIVS